jgi:hypothetical protein
LTVAVAERFSDDCIDSHPTMQTISVAEGFFAKPTRCDHHAIDRSDSIHRDVSQGSSHGVPDNQRPDDDSAADSNSCGNRQKPTIKMKDCPEN